MIKKLICWLKGHKYSKVTHIPIHNDYSKTKCESHMVGAVLITEVTPHLSLGTPSTYLKCTRCNHIK